MGTQPSRKMLLRDGKVLRGRENLSKGIKDRTIQIGRLRVLLYLSLAFEKISRVMLSEQSCSREVTLCS